MSIPSNPVGTPFDRTKAPETPVHRQFEMAPFQRDTIGALEIITFERPDLPILSMSLIARGAGGEHQPLPQSGLASIAAAALTEGTLSKTAVEFAERAESLGGFISSGADWDAASVHAGSLSKHFDDTLSLAVEAFQDAAFRTKDIQRLKSRRLSEIARRESDPGSIAGRELIRLLYGKDSVYGTPLIGDSADLESLDEKDIAAFWKNHSSRQVSLVVAGAIDSSQVRDLASRKLHSLTDSEPEPAAQSTPPLWPTHPPDSRGGGIKVHIFDRPQGAQTQLIIGHPGPNRTHPDRAKLRLLNAIFGGIFSSRINLNLREKHGYTYGANSAFSSRRGPGPFVIQAAIENDFVGDATREVMLELEQIRSKIIDADEVENARSYLLGVQPYGFQTLEGWVSALGTLAVFELPDDWYQQQQKALAAVTADDLLEAAQQHLHPDGLTLVAVGPADHVAPQFEDFSSVEVHRGDG